MLRALIIFVLLTSGSASATQLENMRVVGQAEMNWLFWSVYDAELLSTNGKYDSSQPFALKLTYKMEIRGYDIADRSAEEMRAQKSASEIQLAKWHTQMQEIFPDVKKGDSLTGINDGKGKTVFLYNGKQIGTIKDAQFTSAFFDIWLSTKTSAPEVRRQLLAGI